MIISTKEKKLKTSGSGDFQQMNFGIQEEDMTHIIMLLREKMYQYPVESICREVASNARDANREVGKSFLPIKISVTRNPFLKEQTCIEFEDEGPGISPDRMQEVFMNYGASTKRDTNEQTGGFGLGAKSPFAYTKSFLIETTLDGHKYTYMAAINDGNRGRMILVQDAEDIISPSGTKVTIPVEPKDLAEFEQACIKFTSMWEPQPEYNNFEYFEEANELVKVAEDKNVVLVKEIRKNGGVPLIKGNKVGLLLDGIPYPIADFSEEFVTFKEGLSSFFETSLTADYLFITCGPGDISITPNRESLHYDELTKKLISKKMNAYKKSLSVSLNKIRRKLKIPYASLVVRDVEVTEEVLPKLFKKGVTVKDCEAFRNTIQMYESVYGEDSSVSDDLISSCPSMRGWRLDEGNVTAYGTCCVVSTYDKKTPLATHLYSCLDDSRKVAFVYMDRASRNRLKNIHLMDNYDSLVLVEGLETNVVKWLDGTGVPYLKYSEVPKGEMVKRAAPEKVVKEAGSKGCPARVAFYWKKENDEYRLEYESCRLVVREDRPGIVEVVMKNYRYGNFEVSTDKLYLQGLHGLGGSKYCRSYPLSRYARKVLNLEVLRDGKPSVVCVWVNIPNIEKLFSGVELAPEPSSEYTVDELKKFKSLRAFQNLGTPKGLDMLNRYPSAILSYRDKLMKRYQEVKDRIANLPEGFRKIDNPVNEYGHDFGGDVRFLHKMFGKVQDSLEERYPLLRNAHHHADREHLEDYIKMVNNLKES